MYKCNFEKFNMIVFSSHKRHTVNKNAKLHALLKHLSLVYCL